MGLTLTLNAGESAEVSIPLEDENGQPVTEIVRVTCTPSTTVNRLSITIEAPRDFQIDRVGSRSSRDAAAK